MVQKSSWKTRGFPNEVGSIGEKVGKKWLEKKGYKVYFFQDIMGLFAYLRMTTTRMNRRRKKEYKEKDRKIIQKIEEYLIGVFGQKYRAMKKFDETIRQLVKKEEETRLAQGIKKRRAIGFDFIARKNDNIFFIDVKVNQAELRKYQKFSCKIVRELGFNAMVLRLNVEITIGNKIQLTKPENVYGEGNG
jgi:Holliday junction resolvase-like predicted endonuclease